MKEKSIRWLFMKNYLIIMSISLVIGLTVVENINYQRVRYKNYVEDMENTNRMTAFLDLVIEQTKGQSLEIIIDEDIQSILSKSALLDEKEVLPILNNYLIRNTNLASIYLVDRYNTVVCASNDEKYRYSQQDFLSEFDLSEIRKKEGGDCIGIVSNKLAPNVIYIARSIKSKETGNTLGYLFLFIDASYLEEKMNSMLEKISFEIVVVDDEENMLSFPYNNQLSRNYKAARDYQMASDIRRQWENKYDHIQARYSLLEANVIGRYTGNRKDSTLQMILFGVCVINMLFFLMAIFIIARKVVYPLENIAVRVEEITLKKNLDIRFDENQGYEEVSAIGGALNKMLEQIQFLIKEAKERERTQKVLELSVINHQVNPHFLYNTLNSVSVLVAIEDKESAVELIKSLARYYRSCLNQEEDFNTVEQEMVIAKEYLHIALLKNPDLFEVAYEIDETLKDYKIPRMIIQILAENAVKYGIRTMNEPLQVYVGVRNDIENKRIIVEVRDNGKGIDEETVRRIMHDEKIHSKSGFGLRSIIKRIGLIYNIKETTDIIDIDTMIGHYTKIKIYIPWKSSI